MEQFTSAQALATSTPPAPDFSVDRQAMLKDLNDRENKAYESRLLVDLLQWIESARLVVGQVQFAATYNTEVRRALDAHRIAYDLSWEEPESNGLSRLLGVIHELNRA